MSKTKKPSRASRSAEPPCWPLPSEWDQLIPPQAVKIVTSDAYIDGMVCGKITGPEWNEQWLRGLEAYVRSIVRDELNKANTGVRVGVAASGTPYPEQPGSTSS